MCRAHATVRGLLQEMLAGADHGSWTVVDLEAGTEVMSRATPRAVDALFVVVEPYHRALEVGRHLVGLGGELGIPRVEVIANKVRGAVDRGLIEGYCARHGLPLRLVVAWDEGALQAERGGDRSAYACSPVLGEAAGALADGLRASRG